MNTEQMNRDIAVYIGVDVDFDDTLYRDSRSPLRAYIDNRPKSCGLEFDTSWDWLMPVWQKLRGELCDLDIYDEYEHEQRMKRIKDIEKSIAQDCDLPTAHKLIHEAIQLIKK